MSSKTKTGKSGGAKSVASFVPEPLPPVTPVPVGTDPATILFPEWSDQEVNAEKWDLPKAKDKAKQPSPKKVSSLTPAQFPAQNNLDEPLEFVDPHLVRLPHSLSVHEWKRPSQVFVGTNFIMYNESSEYPDLISGSKHLLHSDFMRSFISAIGILEYLGNTRPSPIEFASPTFVPNTNETPWRPWHHIYSMCKAGKGQKHNPQVNQLGKYVVRLFWLGCWRKLIVDDQLPVDLTNHVLLPSLDKPPPTETTGKSDPSTSKSSLNTSSTKSKGGGKKGPEPKGTKSQLLVKEIEMWPFILCKALLKLANLTQTECNEILDFDIIHCLTGWFMQKIDVTGLEVPDIWEICAGFSDHYTWPDPTKKQAAGSKGGKGSKTSKGEKGSKTSKGSKSGKSVTNFLDDESSGIIPYHLIATCTDMRIFAEDRVPDISPCWSHHFLIDQTRNIPLIKPDLLPELARWKRFRWLAWAIRKGLWPAPEPIPLKCFKMVSVFKKCAEHVIYKPPSKEALDIKKSVAIIEELALEMRGGKKTADKGKENKKASQSSSKGSSKSEKGKKGPVIVPIPPDPSIWIDFNKLRPHINYLYIFFKSSLFKSNIKITDLAQGGNDAKSKADKGKKGKGAPDKNEATSQLLLWNNKISPSRNEPVYLFMDSIDYKLIVINLAQVGNTEALQETYDKSELPCDLEQRRETAEDISAMNRNMYFSVSDEFVEAPISVPEFECINFRVPYAYIIIENYDWHTLEVGNTISFLNTYGTKTMLVDINPGRCVLRMWIKSETSYTINLMSDSPVVAGTLEVVLENMSHESQRLMKLCHDISSSYGQLVQKFGTPQFTEGLVAFCKAYLPCCKLSKLHLMKVHSSFMDELLDIIKEHCSKQEFRERVFALKVLFMNPTLKYDHLEVNQSKPNENMNGNINEKENNDEASDDILLLKKTERAAVTLQAYFKKIYVKKLRAMHKATHKDYMKIFDNLRKIYTNCFGIQIRMNTCSALVRNFLFSNSEICSIKQHFPLLKDLNSTIHLQHFTGEISSLSNSWSPITRQLFYCNSPNSVTVKICLFCGFSKYMVRVFDNDANEEIKRYTNNTAVYAYNNNLTGYTVLCYGWSEFAGVFPWKLDFVTIKIKPVSLIIVPPATICNYLLQQNYIPNVNNNICRCLVSINHDVLVTFRLSTSYGNVKIYFRCMNEVGQIFDEIYGTSSVILPKTMLKYIEIVDDSELSTISIQKSLQSKDRKLSKNKSRSVSLTKTNSKLKRKNKSPDRGSTDKHSLTGSMSSLKKSKSSIISHDIVKYKDTVYVIEGYIIDESWPLTKSEWDVADEVKARSLLGPPMGDTMSDSLKSKERSSTKQSMGSMKRKISEIKSTSSEAKVTDLPFWKLETVSNTEDSLIAIVDERRESEIKSVKSGWYESEPGRYSKSRQLRREYLESHYIKADIASEYSNSIKMGSLSSQNYVQSRSDTIGASDSSYSRIIAVTSPQLSDNSKMSKDEKSSSSINSKEKYLRTLERPVPMTEMLPPLNLQDYMLVDGSELTATEQETEGEMDKYIKTADDEEQLRLSRAKKIEEFKMEQMAFEEDMHKYLALQIARNKILYLFYKGCRGESREMIADAYNLREKVIDTIIEQDMAKQPQLAKTTPSKKKK